MSGPKIKDPPSLSGKPSAITLSLILPLILTSILALVFAALPALVNPEPALAEERLAGADRYQTAVAISQAGWLEAQNVVLVRGDDYADALCAGPLAKSYNAPILFTESYGLNSYTLNEIIRLKAKKVIIVGGYGAISSNIDWLLQTRGITVERIYGNDRYETSVKIAQRLGGKEAALATGEDYADALSISAVAAAKSFPILLTQRQKLPEVVYQHLNNYKISKTYLIGGEGAISPEIDNQVPSPQRFAGTNRYETNVLILDYFSKDLDYNRIFAAPGKGFGNYTYALAGAPLAAKTSSPIILSDSNLPETTADFLSTKMTVGSKIFALGGYDVVPYAVVDRLKQSYSKVLKSVFDQKGVYGPSSGTTTIAGSLAVESPDVEVQNTIIEGDLLLGEGIGSGTVKLKNVTVKGRTTVRGAWGNIITVENFNSGSLVIDITANKTSQTEFRLTGKSRIPTVRIYSPARLNDANSTTEGYSNVEIHSGRQVFLEGSYRTVSFASEGISINLGASTITTLNAGSGGTVWGLGTINTANINTNNVYLHFIPGVTNIAPGINAYINGITLPEGKYTAAQIQAKLQGE